MYDSTSERRDPLWTSSRSGRHPCTDFSTQKKGCNIVSYEDRNSMPRSYMWCSYSYIFSNHGGAVWVKRLELIMRTSLLPSQNIRAFRAHAPSNSSGNVYVRQVYTGTTPEYNGWYTADHEKSYYSAYGVECTKSHFIVHQSFSTAFGGVMYHHHSIRSGRLGLHISESRIQIACK